MLILIMRVGNELSDVLPPDSFLREADDFLGYELAVVQFIENPELMGDILVNQERMG